jgi:hypothetical protein
MASKTMFWVLLMLPVSDVHVPCVIVAVKVNATSVREVSVRIAQACTLACASNEALPQSAVVLRTRYCDHQYNKSLQRQWYCAHGIATTNTIKV